MDSLVQVIIQDDGVGFNPELLVSGKGQKYGLGFMRQRAEEAGGSVQIQSEPGQEVHVVVEVPVK
jgi:two-component system, NarL family, sensor histidine kinase DegS